jgi:hypothetical protein
MAAALPLSYRSDTLLCGNQESSVSCDSVDGVGIP